MSVPQILALLGPAVAVAILRTDRRIVRKLRNAGATEPVRAVTFGDPHALLAWRLRRLLDVGAVTMPAPGSYVLVESGWRAYRARRRRRVLTVLAIVVPAVFMVFWMLSE